MVRKNRPPGPTAPGPGLSYAVQLAGESIMTEKKRTGASNSGIPYCALSGFVFGLYSAVYLFSKQEGLHFAEPFNLIAYFVILMLTVLAVGGLCLLSRRGFGKRGSVRGLGSGGRGEAALAGLIMVGAFAFLYLVYVKENRIYPDDQAVSFIRSRVPRPVYAAAMLLLFVIYVLRGIRETGSARAGRILAVLFFSGLCAVSTYAPNPFTDAGGGIYHIHAYVNSIIHVAELRPFDAYNISIYGHYGLLYLPLVKLLGNDFTAVALSVSFFSFVSFFCLFSVCEQWIRRDSVFLLSVVAICAIPWMFYRNGQYFQVNPHRLLFPAVTVFLISRFLKGEGACGSIRRMFREGLIGTAAVIWNLETGLVCVAVLCAFNLLLVWRREGERHAFFRVALEDGLLVLGCLGGAYLAVNLYSLLAGAAGWMSVSRFIYPMDNQSYRIGELATPLCTMFSVFVLQLILFAVVLLNGARALLRREGTGAYRDARIMLLCVALSGLGAAVYFVNRTAYANITISWAQMVLALGVYGSEGLCELGAAVRRKDRQPFAARTAGKLMMLLCVFAFAVEGGLCLEPMVRKRLNTVWNRGGFEQTAEAWREALPENTLGIGCGVPELLFQIHREISPVVMDWADFNEANRARVLEAVERQTGKGMAVFLGGLTGMEEAVAGKGYEVFRMDMIGNTTFTLMAPAEAGK